MSRYCSSKQLTSVLIESDWNLKEEGSVRTCQINMVLIESDWNLKVIVQCSENERLTY